MNIRTFSPWSVSIFDLAITWPRRCSAPRRPRERRGVTRGKCDARRCRPAPSGPRSARRCPRCPAPCRAGPGCRRSCSRGRSAPRGEEFVERATAGLHLGDLVLGALHRGAGVAHRRRDAADRFADVRRGFGGGVGRLDRLLLGAEGLDLGLEALGGVGELLLLVDDGGVLGLEVGQLAR